MTAPGSSTGSAAFTAGRCVLAVAAFLFLRPAAGIGAETDAPTYPTGYTVTQRLGSELYKSLKPALRAMVHTQPVFLDTDPAPSIRAVEYPGDARPLRAVFISAGFIDLVNNLAHAKAIETVEHGFFAKYVQRLAQENATNGLSDLPRLDDPKFWSGRIKNEQISSFNQMAGTAVAIELAHHYLGHVAKYKDKLEDTQGRSIPINNLLTTEEWDAAFRAGVRNALDAGYTTEGIKALYDAIRKMPQRPVWTVFFLPANLPVPKLAKDLKKIEERFFFGKE